MAFSGAEAAHPERHVEQIVGAPVEVDAVGQRGRGRYGRGGAGGGERRERGERAAGGEREPSWRILDELGGGAGRWGRAVCDGFASPAGFTVFHIRGRNVIRRTDGPLYADRTLPLT